MKECVFCAFAVVLFACSTPLFADQFCGDPLPSYQDCGTPTASLLLLEVNAFGSSHGISAIWYGYEDQKKADFNDKILFGSSAGPLTVSFPFSNQMCYDNPSACPTNPQNPYRLMLPFPSNGAIGQQVYFQINVTDPFHGDYSFRSDTLGSDGIPHVYGLIISNTAFPDLCPVAQCVFLGFKDMPAGFYQGDPTEPDYNDFEMVVWGVDCVSGCGLGTRTQSGEVVTPEPSSLLLLSASGLTLLAGRMRRYF